MIDEFVRFGLAVDSAYHAIRTPAELRSLVEGSPNPDGCVLLISRHSSRFAESLLELDQVLSLRRHGEPVIEGALLSGADAPLEPLEQVATFRGAVPSSRVVAALAAKRDAEQSAVPRPDSLDRARRSMSMLRVVQGALILLMLVVGLFHHPTIGDLTTFGWMAGAGIVFMILGIRALKAEQKAIDHPETVERTKTTPQGEAVPVRSPQWLIGNALLFLALVSLALALIILIVRRFNHWVNDRFIPLELGVIAVAFLLMRVGGAVLKRKGGRRGPGA